MSRRRGEFEHRTSIFEGAFRAWSHLGGLDPLDLENKPASDLDPLTNPIEQDSRLSKKEAASSASVNPDGSSRRQYPYEPLPRSGLAHPYVQAILSPWLGPDADNEAIQLGLTTLRTWWQHRRKGESGSAIAALGTEKMKGVVEGYTRHFFTLAHCLVVNDKEQPPRSLHTKMKDLEKQRKKGVKKRPRDDDGSLEGSVGNNGAVGGALGALPGAAAVDQNAVAALQADLTDSNLSPLERLHAAQRRQMAESDAAFPTTAVINLKGKCIPGKIDLPGVVDAVNRQATQLAHRGGGGGTNHNKSDLLHPAAVLSNGNGLVTSRDRSMTMADHAQYGDPSTTPIVYVSSSGDIQIAMKVDGITCAHCVKIVETVLKGCNGNKSPIDGLLDAAADRVLCSVIVKIDKASSAKRVAFESARNLAMVGYTAKPKEMSIYLTVDGKEVAMDLGILSRAFEIVAENDSSGKDVFDWDAECSCPDNGVLRDDCARHSQMDRRIFEAFDARGQKVKEYMAKDGMQNIGMDTSQSNQAVASMSHSQIMQGPLDTLYEQPIHVDQQMDYSFGMEPPSSMSRPSAPIAHHAPAAASLPSVVNVSHQLPQSISLSPNPLNDGGGMGMGMMAHRRSTLRNPSIISYGNGLRSMSMTSEATFGRAMSGLSALSIDWENLEDFDLEVDHSAHINNHSNPAALAPMMRAGGGESGGARRSSLRRSFMAPPGGSDSDGGGHVTFKV